MFINKTTNTSYGLKAPEGEKNAIVEVPFPISVKQNLIAFVAAITLEPKVQGNFLEVDTLTGATTLNVTTGAEVGIGAEMVIKLTADGTNRVVTPGTNLAGTAVTVTASTTKYLLAKYNGSNWVLIQ